ncbi:hypothetical protein NRIC_04070 [Enterococcus florum]|uniref:Uncharacterized protein n=1 Tax=Enterococcus florum TaxID=2480627 RepID=A0A4P5P504_9ENTE|nr:Gp23 family protein [Enterococcus florum]GCF92516.1 hypothetical protein NRIC_04070 [Enterococcus florum]
MANEIVDSMERTQKMLERAHEKEMIFLVLFVCVLVALGWILWKAIQTIELTRKESKTEREKMQDERTKFLEVLSEEQHLVKEQHEMIKSEKVILEKVVDSVGNIDRKVDLILVKSGLDSQRKDGD